MSRCALVSTLFVISLGCEISEAADPGFYLGVAGGRSEQRLDKQAGVGPIPMLVTLPPDIVPRLPPGGWLPPAFGEGVPVAAIFIPLQSAEADESDVGWNVALGYRVNRYLAAELTYVDSGDASLVERYESSLPPAPGVPALPQFIRSYTVNARGPALSVLGSVPIGSAWEVFARGGMWFADREVTSRFAVVGTNSSSSVQTDADFSDEVVTLGVGVQWSFLPRWTARLEYQRSGDLERNEIMGESRLDQTSLSVLFGL